MLLMLNFKVWPAAPFTFGLKVYLVPTTMLAGGVPVIDNGAAVVVPGVMVLGAAAPAVLPEVLAVLDWSSQPPSDSIRPMEMQANPTTRNA